MEKFDETGKSIHYWLVTSEEGGTEYQFVRKAQRHLFEGVKVLSNTEDAQVICMTKLCDQMDVENTLVNVNKLAYHLDEIDTFGQTSH